MQLSARPATEQWYRMSGEEAAQALMSECERAIQFNASRRAEALMFASLFEGIELCSFDERGYVYDNSDVFPDLEIPIVRNTCRSIVQTAVSKITAQDSPLPQFMSSGGDWTTRTKAVRLDRLVTAEYEQPQGAFSNLHDLKEELESSGGYEVISTSSPASGMLCLARYQPDVLLINPYAGRGTMEEWRRAVRYTFTPARDSS